MEYDDKVIAFFRFEDLRVYHKALEYARWILKETSVFPEGYQHLRNNIQHAAQTIAISIAEGSARNKSQFVYYLKISKSSIRECLVLTSCAYSLSLMDREQEESSRTQLMELTKMIGALIGSLQRTMGNAQEEDEHDDMDQALPRI